MMNLPLESVMGYLGLGGVGNLEKRERSVKIFSLRNPGIVINLAFLGV